LSEHQPATYDPQVLLRAMTEYAKRDADRRYFDKLVLSDREDHVEWTDGKQVRRWRLADQGGAHPEYPILAGIVLARFNSVLGFGGSDRIIFVDPDGAILAHYSPRRLVPVDVQDRILPIEVYQAVAERGVTIRREKYVTEKEFYDRHPDPSVAGFSLSFSRHPLLWLSGVLLVVIAVTNVVMLLNGSYS
jgi:hypothetical protein